MEKEGGQGRGKERGRDMLDQCQTASCAPVVARDAQWECNEQVQ